MVSSPAMVPMTGNTVWWSMRLATAFARPGSVYTTHSWPENWILRMPEERSVATLWWRGVAVT